MSARNPMPLPPALKGPAELVLATAVARRYYLDGKNKIEIADEFSLSRFKVARLLATARQLGLVRIEISYPGAIDVDLSARLRDAFRLQHAIVVDTDDEHEASLRTALGKAAAELLSEIVTPNDVLGLAWARSVSSMASELTRLPQVPVVQLTGALSGPAEGSSPVDADSAIDVVREVARVCGGPAYVFFAPFLVHDAATAEALRRQPDVARAFDNIPSVTTAVMGIGRWAPAQSTLYDAAADPERLELTRQGVCAEIGGIFISSDGEPLHTPLNDRMVAVNAAQLKAIPEVIAIPYGVRKASAVLAALRSGLVHSLVTHASLATALLSDSPVGRQRRS